LAFQWASPKLKRDKDVTRAAVRNNVSVLKYMDDDIALEIVKKKVGRHSIVLHLMPQRYTELKEFVMVFVKQDGTALQYASPALQDDEEVVKTAIAEYRFAKEWASARIKSM